MRVTVEAKPLQAALADIAGLTKRGVDILECVQITAKDNSLHLVISDAEIEGHAKVEAAVAVAGRVCVNASDFKYAIAGSTKEIELELTDVGFSVSGASVNARLPPRFEEFPRFSTPDDMVEIDDGVKAFLACVTSVAREETRFHLCGVGFTGELAYGTNGKEARFHPAKGGEGQIVPGRANAIISKIKGRLFLGDKLWRLENDGRVVVGRLIDANCVDITPLQRNMPEVWTCGAAELREKVETVTFKRAGVVVISGEEGKLHLSAEKFEGTHIDSRAEVGAEGIGGATIVCSAKGLSSILTGMSGRLSLCTDGGAIELRAGDLRGLSMVMRDPRNTGPKTPELEGAG